MRKPKNSSEKLCNDLGGKAGGFIAEFVKLVGEIRGTEFAPIKFEVADDLSYWSAEIPGRIVAKAEAVWTYDSTWKKSTDY